MLKRSILLVLLFAGAFLVTARSAHAQTLISSLGYDGWDLTGYSIIGNNPYSETEDCLQYSTDGDGTDYCADAYVYESWVGIDGHLNGNLWGSDLGTNDAEVNYDIYEPGAGAYSAEGYNTVGETQYEFECIALDDCGQGIYEGWWLIAAYYSYSNEVDISHVTNAWYSGSFYAPGTLSVTASFNYYACGSCLIVRDHLNPHFFELLPRFIF